MLKKLLIAFLLLAISIVAAFAARAWYSLQPKQEPLALPGGLIALSAAEGQALLASADALVDYEPLAVNFESQELRSYCGVASSVTVLNALGGDVDQWDFFSGPVADVKPRLEVMFGGMTLTELGALLEAHGMTVTLRHADSITLEEFREALRSNLGTAGDFLLVNYQREVLGQRRVGHISPAGAYDEESDRVLILDTAAYNYPPTWVPVPKLYAAMATTDPSSGKSRGFVEVSRFE